MPYPLPAWIAHRGGGALAPENTLAGIRLASRLGFRAVEFDVMLTADGEPILIHDETLERTTNGRGRVAKTSWSAIGGLDAGGRFHRAWAGEPVPSLNDALTLCAALGLAANVEIKPAAGQEADTGRVAADLVARVWPPGLPVLLSSFSEAALAAARQVQPALPRALLVEAIPADWQARITALGCIALHAASGQLFTEGVQELAAAGVPVAAYTVNDAAEAWHCFDMGVSALFTDRLDNLGRT